MKSKILRISLLVLSLWGLRLPADELLVWQDSEKYDFSLHAGPFLPFGIVGVRDNYPFWGMSFSHPTSFTRIEYTLLHGRAKGVKYYNGALSLRFDFQALDYLQGFAKLGADFHYYQRKRTQLREFPFYQSGGMHMGFGGLIPIVEDFFFRSEFKFNFGPGRSLYVGLGFTYAFGAEENAQP